MKKFLVSGAGLVIVLAMAWAVFAQSEQRQSERPAVDRRRFQRLSEEERARMRERWQNMSEQEREKFRAQMRERFGGMRRMGREEQLKAIKTIEEQLAKLKAALEAIRPEQRRSFRELSEEERARLRERFTKARQDRQKTIQAIITQIAGLQGQRQPQGEQFIIINTGELKSLLQLAEKEKAQQTAQRLERLLVRGRGLVSRPPRPRTPRTVTPTPDNRRRARVPEQSQSRPR